MSWVSARVAGLALAGSLVFASSGRAGDLYRGGGLKDGAIYPFPVQSWTGFYFGTNIGGAFNNGDDHERFHSFDGFYPYDGQFFFVGRRHESSAIGGVQVGYNWQGIATPFVVGIEGDIDFADRIDFLSSIRGRVGYATPNVLFYFTGGAAFIGLNDDRDLIAKYPQYFRVKRFRDDNETGFVVGGGVDFRPGCNLFGVGPLFGSSVGFGVEGLFYSFDNNEHFDVFNRYDDFLGSFRGDDRFDFWVVRARMNYYLTATYVPLK